MSRNPSKNKGWSSTTLAAPGESSVEACHKQCMGGGGAGECPQTFLADVITSDRPRQCRASINNKMCNSKMPRNKFNKIHENLHKSMCTTSTLKLFKC